jgi:hypothetical protein
MGVKNQRLNISNYWYNPVNRIAKLLISVYFSRELTNSLEKTRPTGSKLNFSGANSTTKSPFYSTPISNFSLQFRL